jgi:hypothetical protein
MKKLLPILMALIGIGGGIGAGIALKPEPQPEIVCGPDDTESEHVEHAEVAPEPAADGEDTATHEYVKLNNQFVVPIVKDGEVGALVVLALNLEVVAGFKDSVFQLEPKLRNAFLLVLFDHANAGGFNGTFTSSNNMTVLQNALLESAHSALGNSITGVLITDVVRQEVTG